MFKNIVAFVVFLGGISFSMAQTATIKGIVVSSSQNKPLPDATVRLVNTSYGEMTNNNGAFIFREIPAGNYTLEVSLLGYASQEKSIIVNKNETVKVAIIKLAEQEEELDEVVVNGHQNKYVKNTPSQTLRLNTEVTKLPQNIQIIGGELLQDQLATTMMEGVIRNVSGVNLLEHWGNFARVNMRGFRLPAFRNGFNFQDTWGPLSEDMAFVEQIEFVKGPAGFMMSAGEPGGFYNVVTKKPTNQSIANINIMGGSYDFYRGNVDLGGKLTENGKLLYRFNAMYQTSDSHRGNEDAERYGFAPAITYNFSDKTSITTELNYNNAESFLGSAYVFATVADGYGSLARDFKFTDDNYKATDISELSFFTTLKHDFNENWSAEAKFAYLRYDQVGNSTWLWSLDETTGDAVRYASIWDALSLGKFAQVYLYGTVNTGSVKHNLLGGFDFTERNYWADFSQFGLIDVDTPFNIYNPVYGNTVFPEFDRSVDLKFRGNAYSYGYTNRSFYLQDEINLFEDKVRLTLAGRYTNLSTLGKEDNDKIFTPRAGLSVDILPNLTAYALYDQAFNPNSGISATGDSFDPEEGNDIEGGIKKSFFEGKLKTSLGAFLITKQNVLVTDPDNTNYSIQLGEIQSKGIEFDLQGQITSELNLILNYANTNVEITEDSDPDLVGTRVAGHAKHMTNGWLNYSFSEDSKLKGFGASIGYQYQIDRSTWAWGADNQSDLPDYFRLDGGLSWKNKKIRIQANVNNILNEYLYSGANYSAYLYWQSEPGINGRLSLTYSF